MNLQELKQQILDNSLSDEFMIFQYEDSDFLVNQYIDEICKQKGFEVNRINALAETVDSAVSLVFDFSSDLNVLYTEEFNEISADYEKFTNSIVVCKTINKIIQKEVDPFIIKFPKVEDWQVKAYMEIVCEGLTEEQYSWLYSATKKDLYRIKSELDKINLFNKEDRQKVIYAIKSEENTDLTDYYSKPVWDFTNAIILNNKQIVYQFLMNKQALTIEAFSLIGILINKYKEILYVCFNSGADLNKLNINSKKAYVIKKTYGHLPLNRIAKNIKFLANTEMRIKLGKLELKSWDLFEYILCNLLY